MASLHQQTVPIFIHYLNNLSAILDKAAKFCAEKPMEEETMLSTRLIEDMLGLRYQIQSVTNTAKHTVKRVGNMEVPFFEDDEKTFAELQTRIQRTIDVLQGADADAMEAFANKEVLMETAHMGTYRFDSGQSYCSTYAIPYFHFHLSTAYCILRQQGVPIGAFDYCKDVFHKA